MKHRRSWRKLDIIAAKFRKLTVLTVKAELKTEHYEMKFNPVNLMSSVSKATLRNWFFKIEDKYVMLYEIWADEI